MTWFFLALTAAILLAVASIVEKKTLVIEHAMEFSATLAVVNGALSIPLAFFADFSKINLTLSLFIYAVSWLATGSFFLLAKINRHMQISESSPLLLMAPMFSVVLGFLILGERLSLIQLLGIGLLLLGAYFLEVRNKLSDPIKIAVKSRYIHFIIITSVIYGFGTVFDRTILNHYSVNPMAYISLIHFFIAINFLILISVFHNGIRGVKHGFKQAGWLILFVGVLTIAHRLAYAQAISLAFIGLVASIKRSSVLFTTIVGGELFGEKNLLRKTMAVVIMLSGLFLLIR